jgi:CubicO group peptidase (beta-lactamase class C family)
MFRNRRSRRDVLLLGGLLAAPALLAPDSAGPNLLARKTQDDAGDEAARLVAEAVVAPWMAAHGASGAVLGVMRRGKPILKWGYGARALDDPTRPDADTIFHIASVAKTVTGHAILLLVQDGRVRLDAPAISYLTELPPQWAPITVRQFLCHVSGIRNVAAFFGADWNAAMAQARKAPVEPPGRVQHYVNFNYAVIGKLIERVSGMGYADFVQARIFDPLGMRRSFVGRTVHPNQATGYLPAKDGWFTPLTTTMGADWWPPAGWMQSSLNDVMAFVDAVFGKRLVKEPVWSDGMRAYGPKMQGAAGWFSKTRDDQPTWEKLGRIAGFSADVEFDARGDGIVLMWNCQTYRDDSIVARALLRQRLLGLGTGAVAGQTSSVIAEQRG